MPRAICDTGEASTRTQEHMIGTHTLSTRHKFQLWLLVTASSMGHSSFTRLMQAVTVRYVLTTLSMHWRTSVSSSKSDPQSAQAQQEKCVMKFHHHAMETYP